MRLSRTIYSFLIGLLTTQISCNHPKHVCLGSSKHAIVNGTVIPETSAPAPVVLITFTEGWSSGLCTGILLTNDWVLTAGHCTEGYSPSYKIYLGSDLSFLTQDKPPSKATQVRTADLVLSHPKYLHDNLKSTDVGLLHVTTPFIVDNSTTSYELDLYDGSRDLIIGQPVTLFGYGCTDYNAETVDDQLREAELTVGGFQSGHLWTHRNSSQQSGCFGDSGGPMLLPGTHTLVAIFFAGNTTNGDNWGIFTADFRDWVLTEIDINHC